MDNHINIAICGDKNAEIGLHITLFSLLKNTSNKVRIYFIYKDFSEGDINFLKSTLEPFSNSYELIPILFSDIFLKTLHPFYGTRLNYARMLLTNYIDEDKIIYLDFDIIINLDIYDLYSQSLDNKTIGVVCGMTVEHSVDCEFLNKLGIKKNEPYFNSGVLLINLKKWRIDNKTSECLNFAVKYTHNLRSSDQTVLNYIFHDDFKSLSSKYNKPLFPNTPYIDDNSSRHIFHFNGSPKPWDIGGKFLHNNYKLYEEILKETSFRKYNLFKYISYSMIKRHILLSRAYYHTVMRKIKKMRLGDNKR